MLTEQKFAPSAVFQLVVSYYGANNSTIPTNTRPSEVTIPYMLIAYVHDIRNGLNCFRWSKCEATKILLKYEATKCCSNVRLQSKWWLGWILSRHQSAKCNLFSTRLMDNSSTSKFRFSETKFIQKPFYIYIHIHWNSIHKNFPPSKSLWFQKSKQWCFGRIRKTLIHSGTASL